MDDLDVLARDFGFGARGKSNPMRSGAQSDRRSIDEPLFSDVFGGPPKYTRSSNPINNEFDYDSIFKSSEPKSKANNSSSGNQTASSLPVYDKPVYDEDIFDGLPGLKNKSGVSTVKFDNSVFTSVSSPPRSNTRNQKSDFDDLLGNVGRNENVSENYKSSSVKSSSNAKGLDDLLAGYSTGSSAASNRPTPVSSRSSGPIASSKNRNILDDPFVVLESSATPGSSSPGLFVDPLEDINKFGKSGSARVEASSGSGGGAFDELDPLSGFGKAAQSFSSNRDDRGKNESPSRAALAQSDTSREQKGISSFRYSDSNIGKKVPVDNTHEPPFFNVPNVSPDFEESFSQPMSPQYHETGSHIDTSPVSERRNQFDDIWLTVSEIPLFTQPTAAPPPSRPPPPLPWQTSKSEAGYFSSSSRKNGDEFISPKAPPVSQFDEARVRAERAAVQRAQAEARERAAAEAKERAEKVAAEARERATASAAAAKEKELRAKAAASKVEAEARRRADQAAVERAIAEARERAAAEARKAAAAAKLNQQKSDNDLESFFSTVRPSSAPRTQTNSVDPLFNQQFQNRGRYDAPRWTSASNEPSSSLKKPSSTTNIVDDLSSIFGGAPSSGEFPDVEGETEERRRARLDRHQRTQERAAKALAEKNQRDVQVQREQEERHRISETLDIEIKRWAAGKEGNLRALLSTLQYVLWPECGWQPVSLTDLIIGASVKKYYRKATLCIHPDKVQQKGATLQQKYIAEKVFDLLKEAWNKFNSEELF